MSRRVRLAVWFVLGCVAVGVVMTLLYVFLRAAVTVDTSASTTTAIRDAQRNNNEVLHRIVTLSHHIDDCTNQGGRCFNANQRRTGEALASLNQTAAARAACTVVLSRQTRLRTAAQLSRQIDRCTTETVARLTAQTSHR